MTAPTTIDSHPSHVQLQSLHAGPCLAAKPKASNNIAALKPSGASRDEGRPPVGPVGSGGWSSHAKWAGIAGLAGAGLVCGGGPLILGGLGFSGVGPVAGSHAAGWMASITAANGVGISAGSTYAVLQSTAMTGTLFSIKAAAASSAIGVAVGEGLRKLRKW